MLKGKSKGKALIPFDLAGVAGVEFDAADGIEAFLFQNFRYLTVDQGFSGAGHDFLGETALDDAGGHLALAETVKGQIRAETAHGGIENGVHARGGHSDGDFARNGGNDFNAVFHEDRLLA